MGFKTTFGFRFRNPIVHDRGYGMNASVISGSVLGSPGRASHRNFFSQMERDSIYTPHRVSSSVDIKRIIAKLTRNWRRWTLQLNNDEFCRRGKFKLE